MSRTLLTGGVIYVGGSSPVTAMIVDGDIIAELDPADRAGDAVGRVVDLAGALVTPAFVDAHVHSTATGLALEGLDLTGCRSRGDLLDRVSWYADGEPTGPVLGHGWDEFGWPDPRPPTGAELDTVAGGRAVYLARVDAHAAAVSSAVLAGLDGLRGYAASGLLTAEAHGAARQAAFAMITPQMRRSAQRATRRRAAAHGIAQIHELGGPELSSLEDLRLSLELAATEAGPDVIGYWGELGGAERAKQIGARGAAGDIFADGTIGSHTACVSRVYDDAPHRGCEYVTAAQVRDHVLACVHAGLQAGFHTIGDGAIETVVTGFEEAAAQVGRDAVRRGHHRLEHVEMADRTHVTRMAALGLHASVQPAFDALWGGPDGMYAARLGADRAVTLNRFSALVDAGIVLAFGSDSPITEIDPWAAVRAAVWHHAPGQRLPLDVAFAAHTVGGRRAAGLADTGELRPGAPATFAVWDFDGPLTPSGLPVLDATGPLPRCRRTVLRGRTIHQADGSAGPVD